MKAQPIRDAWAAGRTVTNLWLDIGSSLTAEALGKVGFDALTIDLQHSLIDQATAVAMLQSISLGNSVPFVRVAQNHPTDIGFALDAGAFGIIGPLIESAEDCRRFVAACRYPPQGNRSWGPMRGLLACGEDYFALANDDIIKIALIETKAGIDNIDEIARTPGLDAIYLGPNDMAISYGGRPSYLPSHPDVLLAMNVMLRAAKDAGIVPAVHCGSIDMALSMKEKGFRFVTLMSDTKHLIAAAKAAVSAVGK
jgi:4-hydroxy-2-oxoheptanedioate aldolase